MAGFAQPRLLEVHIVAVDQSSLCPPNSRFASPSFSYSRGRSLEASLVFPSISSSLSSSQRHNRRFMSSPNSHTTFLCTRNQQLHKVSKRHFENCTTYVTTTTAGLPVISSVPVVGPLVNFILSPPILLAAYIAGAVRFWGGFSRTTYNDSLPTKLPLTAMWPVLLMASPEFRANFKKAVK